MQFPETDGDGPDLSVLIPVRNEEVNIAAVLDTVGWSDDVWIVDSRSADRTAAIASRYPRTTVVQFDYKGEGPKKKNWALENLPFRHEWVLLLDADERITPNLAREIRQAIMANRADGYYLDVEYVFLGRALKCKRPNWNLRLFKHRLGRFEILGSNVPHTGDVEVHEQLVLSGRSGYLAPPLVHQDRRPVRALIDNHHRYAEWEAEVYVQFRHEGIAPAAILSRHSVWRKRALKRLWVRLPFRPLGRFVLFYVVRRGFLDGKPGFIYSVLMAYYEFLISVKLYERSLARQEIASSSPSRNLTEELSRR